MATKTFCDKCGSECVNGVTHASLRSVHTTSQGEHVGSDEYKPAELCITCGEIAARVLGMALLPSYPRDDEQPRHILECDQPMVAIPHRIELGGGLAMERREPGLHRAQLEGELR